MKTGLNKKKIVFSQIIEEQPNGLLVLDNDLDIIFFNNEILEITGFDKEEITDENINNFDLIPQDPLRSKKNFIDCLKKKKELKANFYFRNNNKNIQVFLKTKVIKIDDQYLTLISLNDLNSIMNCDINKSDEDSKIKLLQERIIGKNKKIISLYKMIILASESMSNVYITGESGTGKELIARAIHDISERKNMPFITVNCSALSESLLESELFGHVKGSFTGAYNDKIGKFESAQKGTVFLDEIGDISPLIQLKLLRVIQEKVIARVGDNKEIKVDMRIITATNKNLRELVLKGEFREDLFYRLNVFPIYTPSLRDRTNDIPILVEYFIKKFNRETGKNIKGFTENGLRLLMDYCWPGNIRELENSIEHAFVVCNNDQIDIFDLPQELRQVGFREGICKDLDVDKVNINIRDEKSLKSLNKSKKFTPRNIITKDQLIKVLKKNNWNKAETSRQLGISRTALWKKMKKFGI